MQLIVSFRVEAQSYPLPSGITAKSVKLSKNGIEGWSEEVSFHETSVIGLQKIEGVARGCATASFSEGDELELRIRVASGTDEADVVTTVKLFTAY
jgi:hypothetical protein